VLRSITGDLAKRASYGLRAQPLYASGCDGGTQARARDMKEVLDVPGEAHDIPDIG
jgi:hypothetical protein